MQDDVYNAGMMKSINISAFALTAIVAPAMSAEAWNTDLPAALTQAAAEKKNVLILFTGSDWCPPCQGLKENVLTKPEFAAYAKDKYILVEIDLPRQKKLPDGLLEKNRALANKYNIEAYPTMLVMTPEGIIVSGFAGARPSVEALSKDLVISDTVAAALSAAASATGEAKAKALYDAYKALPDVIRASNVTLLEQVKANDPNDTLGLKKEAEAKAAAEKEIQRIHQLFRACGNDLNALLKVVDTELAKPDIAAIPELFLIEVKLDLLMTLAETKEDIKAIQDLLYKLAEKNKDNAEQIKAFADGLMEKADALLEHAKQRREAMMKK